MKVIVGMATTSARKEFAEIAMASLRDQVDSIILYNNDEYANDLTDNGKFYGLNFIEEPCYYFTCDDDIIYPATYVKDMIAKIEEYGCIVTHHGRRLKGLNVEYYRGHYGYRCLSFNPADYPIEVAGTGVTAFRTDYFFCPELSHANDKRMADCIFSLEAMKQGKKIMVLAHKEDYFQGLEVPRELTIYAMEKDNATRQMEICNEIYKLKTK